MSSYQTSRKWLKRKLSSRRFLSPLHALLLLFLLPLLTACSTSSVKLVPVQPAPLPASLLAQCQPSPPPSDPLTFGASVEWNLLLLTDLKNCNAQLVGIKKIEDLRVTK